MMMLYLGDEHMQGGLITALAAWQIGGALQQPSSFPACPATALEVIQNPHHWRSPQLGGQPDVKGALPPRGWAGGRCNGEGRGTVRWGSAFCGCGIVGGGELSVAACDGAGQGLEVGVDVGSGAGGVVFGGASGLHGFGAGGRRAAASCGSSGVLARAAVVRVDPPVCRVCGRGEQQSPTPLLLLGRVVHQLHWQAAHTVVEWRYVVGSSCQIHLLCRLIRCADAHGISSVDRRRAAEISARHRAAGVVGFEAVIGHSRL